MEHSATRTVFIEGVKPELDGGRYPVKREVGDRFEVSADILKEGHDVLAAVVRYREKGDDGNGGGWREAPMRFVDNDRWAGSFELTANTRYLYTVVAWADAFLSWRNEFQKKSAAGQDIHLELEEGRLLIADAVPRAAAPFRQQIALVLDQFAEAEHEQRIELVLSERVQRLLQQAPDRSLATTYDRELEVIVDRVRARFAAWYEMVPRSQGTVPGKSATFADCVARLPEIRNLGFDVVYLTPIHPIGRTHRKGPNNTLNPGPDDPGSFYAIGNEEGGHTAIHAELGTLDDFRNFVVETRKLDMEIALDIAIQCSPDHPYIAEHPEWFSYRPDGTIKHAENPPKKYQDIVNVNFYGEHREALWREWRNVFLFWIKQGVRIFRVDNPHTKPVQFWEWLIADVQHAHPDVIFLAEAFTRPKLLQALAKAGFTQSYTYFTWRNFKQELTEYLTELTQTEVREYLRPNFFVSTPDILPGFLQTGGRPAHQIRLILAATLSSVYGIYNSFELCENAAVPDSEEFLHSEKYEYKVWDWDRPGNIKDYIAAINRIRAENPALHEFENLRFYPADDDNILFYGKADRDRANLIFIAVNLDPFEPHQAVLEFPLAEMGIKRDRTFQVEELLSGKKHLWRGARHSVDLDPQVNPAEIYRISPWAYKEYAEPCF
ncbi:MAG: alpha-1,4-glucan--maltose-1-phosphate maltosyltransferase [Burkholderiales bacterium]|nr:alpha-1,4-glucan--maltose-1-phosphate maltosyltransferase [Burkholderiales bacterium]